MAKRKARREPELTLPEAMLEIEHLRVQLRESTKELQKHRQAVQKMLKPLGTVVDMDDLLEEAIHQ